MIGLFLTQNIKSKINTYNKINQKIEQSYCFLLFFIC